MRKSLGIKLPALPLKVYASEHQHDWIMTITEEDCVFVPVRPKREDRARDVFINVVDIREKFKFVRTKEQALRFLHESQCLWDPINREDIPNIPFREFALLQNLFKRASMLPVGSWASLKNHFHECWVDELLRPVYVSLASDKSGAYLSYNLSTEADASLIVAIGALYQLEKFVGMKYRVCKRIDCDETFDSSARKNRGYCVPGCGSVVSMRKLRKKRANASDEV